MRRNVRVKPGKTQSVMGLAVGIVFLLIGIFVIIPMFSVFGIFWTLCVAAITIVNGYNAFSKKGITSHEIIIDDNSGDDEEQRLIKIKEMYDKGLITYEEYEKKKKEIIDDI